MARRKQAGPGGWRAYPQEPVVHYFEDGKARPVCGQGPRRASASGALTYPCPKCNRRTTESSGR